MATINRTMSLPRLVGFSLAVLMTILHRLEGPGMDLLAFILCFICVFYPVAFFGVQRRRAFSNLVNHYSLVFDAILVALLISVNGFHTSTGAAFSTFLVLSAVIQSGTRVIFLVVLVGTLTTALLSFVVESRLQVFNTFLETVLAIVTVLYVGYIAWLVFRKTGGLEKSRRQLKEQQEKLHRQSDYLSRYVSPQLLAEFQETQHVDQTRRRRLTLCFTDLAGFTGLMDRLPEHEMTLVLNEYLDAMAEIAISYGATIDKFMGDGVMVFFGDPNTKGVRQDAASCVNMALAMVACLKSLTERWQHRGLACPLQMRIGIHTGYCAVGNFGSESRMDYTAIGGAVNIASRLENLAPRGAILVSAATAELLGDEFELGPFLEAGLKGIKVPVRCAVVLGTAQKKSNPLPLQLLR